MKSYRLDKPIFTISIDFEKVWGVFPDRNLGLYYNSLAGVDSAVDGLLKLFNKYDIHATWAIVGFLYSKDYNEIYKAIKRANIPYKDLRFSPTCCSDKIIRDLSLSSGNGSIEKIRSTLSQEIATHTYSHLLCIEEGVTINEIRQDIEMAISVGSQYNDLIKSIIFPRNQYSSNIVDVCAEYGISSYRGLGPGVHRHPRRSRSMSRGFKALRYLDGMLNLTGHKVHRILKRTDSGIWNLPDSFFVNGPLLSNKFTAYLVKRRVCEAMLSAAKTNSLCHLWFHPHNFGVDTEKRLSELEEILKWYKVLNGMYGMVNRSMLELVADLEVNLI